MSLICPFCGNETKTTNQCSACGSLFNAEIRHIAVKAEDDDRSDMIGPFSTKTAKRLLWVLMALLIAAFIIATELTK